MPLVSMRQLLDHAAENGYGLPAFNVNNLEQVTAIMQAADEVGAPRLGRTTECFAERVAVARAFRRNEEQRSDDGRIALRRDAAHDRPPAGG